jgi:hypothetical protein
MKSNMEDLALGLGEGSFFGAARNSVDPRFSTAGSGAAVAAGKCDMALGADNQIEAALDGVDLLTCRRCRKSPSSCSTRAEPSVMEERAGTDFVGNTAALDISGHPRWQGENTQREIGRHAVRRKGHGKGRERDFHASSAQKFRPPRNEFAVIRG